MIHLLISLLFLNFIFSIAPLKDYKYDYLNNTIELRLIDSKNHLLATNISSYNIGEIVHIFIKIPTGGEEIGYSKDKIKFFTLKEDYSNLESINIPDNFENISVKMEKD